MRICSMSPEAGIFRATRAAAGPVSATTPPFDPGTPEASRKMRTRITAADTHGDKPGTRPPPRAMGRSRAKLPGPVPALAAVLFLAALGSCDSDPVVEPEAALEVVPDSVTLTHLGQQFAFSVRGGGGEETGQVRWSSLDGAVFTVDSDGTVTARGNGVAHVQAWTRESSDQALVRVRQVAAALEAVGSGQRTTPGQPPLEPVGVRVLDAGGSPASGAAVRFEPAPGSGRVEPSEAYSDDAGVAVVRWMLGPRPGRQTLWAVAAEGGASVEIEATALDPGEAAASLEVRSGEDQWAVRGRAVPEPVSVRVTDEMDRPVWGATVRFEPDEGSGRADPETAATDSLGLATAVWTLGSGLGGQRLVAKMAGGATVTFEATAVSDEGVCNRTPAVSAEIARTLGLGNCSEVTEEMLGGILHLALHRKGIRRLRSGDFAGLLALDELYLDENGLTELPSSVFSDLSQLRRLLLGYNQLTLLPPQIFQGLHALEDLILWGNRLRVLTSSTLSHLEALSVLRLDYNELTELPEDLFYGLSNLEILTMRGNELISLPEGMFSGLSRLNHLVVAGNRLTELPPGLFSDTPALGHIVLDGNQLTELPPILFSETPALQRLFLRDNQLTMLPPGVFDRLLNLYRLDLGYNELAALPPGIFAGTPRLAELSLEVNALAELPPGLFTDLSELEWVDLDGNPGVPFPVQPEFVRVDDDLLAPGPARVAVRVPLGAPFAFEIPISVQRGTMSHDAVSLLPGDTVSTAFEVSANAGGGAAHVGFGPPPEVRAEGYEGLKVVRGEELVLFAEANNRSPVARTPIPAHRLQAGGSSAALALGHHFDDPDGDPLAYSVATTESGVVAARIEDGMLWLDPGSVDTTEVEVTATDPRGLRATHRFRTWVVPAPDPDAFNIELYFDSGFTAEEEAAVRRAAIRWMEAVTGDLPDVPVNGPLSDFCFSGPSSPRVVGVIDDVLIHMRFAARLGRAAATAGTCGEREESGQAFLGVNSFALWYHRDPEPVVDQLYESSLHEIGHVLGIGDWVYSSDPPAWRALFRAGDGDGHFTGPRAVAAFNAAGGEGYGGGKVPLEDKIPVLNIHWRKRVIPGDIMAPGGGSLLTAITIQALADLGYEVDVSQADPYSLPKQAQGDIGGVAADAEGADAELFADDVIKGGPVVVVDKDGKVVRVIRP